jgi:H+/gluconate symporter-like permease
MRDDDRFDRSGHVTDSKSGMLIAGVIVAIAIIALIIWAPWNNRHTASNPSGTTVGQSNQTPAPAKPSAPASSPSR